MRIASLLLLALAATGAESLDGRTLELPGGTYAEALRVSLKGGTIRATAPATISGAVTLDALGSGGLDATVIATSLRGVAEDDWRASRPIAGRRRDAQISFPSQAPGTAAERAAWKIGGTDEDWDGFSFQWDGFLRIEHGGTELSTASDDGSRVWLDLDNDGKVDPGEWGVNGWGGGQGTTTRVVHRKLKPGIYRIRVQYEEGGGGNAMSVLWRTKGDTVPVPAEAFRAAAMLAIEGPATLAAPVSGPGNLLLRDGTRLGVAPQVASLTIEGHVALTADLDLTGVDLRFSTDAVLALDGHAVRLGAGLDTGTIDLAGGNLTLGAGRSALRLTGSGTAHVSGEAVVGSLGDGIRVEGGLLRADDRCVGTTVLAAPLTTVLRVADAANGPRDLEAVIDVPAGVPPDLGVGVWRADGQGRWFQRVAPGALAPGLRTVRFALDGMAGLAPEGHGGRWSGDAAADAGAIGLFFFSTAPSAASLAVDARLMPASAAAGAEPRLAELQVPSTARTGMRWEMAVRPEPYPDAPCDPDDFILDLAVVQPDGVIFRVAGFHDEPVTASDRGDIEEFRTAGAPVFHVRFRPRQAGLHRLRLTARWKDRPPLTVDLPGFTADGEPWDGITRVDAQDSRFFSAGGAFVWPAGCNLNSTYDIRSRGALQTKLTPDRGSFTRGAFLERLAAAGGTGCETWLSPWNLGLEWIPKWPGYRGTGRYHPGHAWALDRFLDRAEVLGVRVNLSLFNHGMARAGSGAEEDWEVHPYFRGNGGWLDEPKSLFEDDRAFARQKALFRYLGARYGDSPALLGWKLWAEVNLAQAPRDSVVAWHARASATLGELDPWKHPVTTHWCGDWRNADRDIAAIPTMGYLTIDAYKGDETLIADLLCQSTRDPLRRGLGIASFGKPVLTTEFGGSAGATGIERMRAEHAIGPWAGLVSGHAGSPMLWWFEWIDQEERFGVYGAVNRFIAGEDLRGKEAQCIAPSAYASTALWCRAWSRPGRLLGYLLDQGWGMGGEGRPVAEARVLVGAEVRAGAMTAEWWDADTGAIVTHTEFDHPGGKLELTAPTFSRHLAFKLIRQN